MCLTFNIFEQKTYKPKAISFAAVDSAFPYNICYVRKSIEENDESSYRSSGTDIIRHMSTVADVIARLQMVAFQGPYKDWKVNTEFANAVIISLRVKRDAINLLVSSRQDRNIFMQFDIETSGGDPPPGFCVCENNGTLNISDQTDWDLKLSEDCARGSIESWNDAKNHTLTEKCITFDSESESILEELSCDPNLAVTSTLRGDITDSGYRGLVLQPRASSNQSSDDTTW
jgi:hypothetical protein